MGLTLAKCPACGADLNLEIDRDYFYCPHCGSKVLKEDNRIVIEHVTRSIDETRIKELDVEQKKIEAQEVLQKKLLVLILPFIVILLAIQAKAPGVVILSLVLLAAFIAYKMFGGRKQ